VGIRPLTTSFIDRLISNLFQFNFDSARLILPGAIKGEDLSDVVCVVVRYFGGVKLGAGGLIRAYGGAARLVLREAPVMETQPKASFRLSVDSTYVGAIYGALAEAGALPSAEEYGADGSFSVSVTCELDVLETLQTSLTDATKGTVEFSDDH